MILGRRVIAMLALVLVAAACGGDADVEALPTDTAAILAAAADVMGEVDTVRFTISRGGAPVYLDDGELLEFVSAEGRFVAPDSADAVVTLSVGGITTRIGAVAVDGQTWLSNPVTAKWEPAPASYAFDPAILFDPDLGWRPLLASGLHRAAFTGREERGGDGVYHLTGTADAARVETVTAGLVRGQDVDVDLWLDEVTGRVVDVEFTTRIGEATSDWALSFFDYGVEMTIDIPDLSNP